MSLLALEGALSSLNEITVVTLTGYLAWGLNSVNTNPLFQAGGVE